MSTQLSNLIEKNHSNKLLEPHGSEAFSQIRVVNVPFNTTNQLAYGKSNAFVSVNFPVDCVNVITIVCNTNSTNQIGTQYATGILHSNLVPSGSIIGPAYFSTYYSSLLQGAKSYYTTPQFINGNYEFWWTDSTGAPIVLDSTSTFDTTIIFEFVGMNSGQVPVTSS